MNIKNQVNKKNRMIQLVLLVVMLGLFSACSQGGGSAGESLIADNTNTPGSPGTTVAQNTEVLVTKAACAEWGNTRVEANGEQVNCLPLKGQSPYKRIVLE